MFFLRAVTATLSLFLISYVLFSVGLALAWRPIARFFERRSARSRSQALYLLRVTPPLSAFVISLAFELPSFLRFEPALSNEGLGWLPLLFSGAVLICAVAALIRMARACGRTARFYRESSNVSSSSERHSTNNCGRKSFGPPVAVAGAFHQRLVLSPELSSALEPEELRCALEHEAAHMRSRDNLRKLLLIACRFPGLSSLEREWAEAVEFAADEGAVRSRREALALASAILKVAKLHVPAIEADMLVTNFVGSAAGTALRIQKLTSWTEQRPVESGGRIHAVLILPIAFVGLAASYPAILAGLHSFTEVLFR